MSLKDFDTLKEDDWIKYCYSQGLFMPFIYSIFKEYILHVLCGKSNNYNIPLYDLANIVYNANMDNMKPTFNDIIRFIILFDGVLWDIVVVQEGNIKNSYVYIHDSSFFNIKNNDKIFRLNVY